MGPTIIPADGFDGMMGLMILVLSNMNLHGPIPELLGKLPNLRVLHLDGNRLNGSIPKGFKNLRSLSELRLNDNGLIGPVPFDREMVWRMKRKLRLYNNSGLCYDARSGLGDGVDSTLDFGIGLCENENGNVSPGSVRTVRHIWATEKPGPITTMDGVSSSDAAVRRSSLGIATFVVLFALILL